jgi:hypothetical protein
MSFSLSQTLSQNKRSGSIPTLPPGMLSDSRLSVTNIDTSPNMEASLVILHLDVLWITPTACSGLRA